MNARQRLLFAAAALSLLLVFLMPLWTISLHAPQYPEGLGLKIWAHQITGQQEQDLHNINGLNHYIGMKRIEPDSIPELRILPRALLAFAALGLLGAALGRRWLLGLWLALLLAGGVGALYDFWSWEYDYGHNLNPEAAIKVPGMSYQPPLIGTRQLLNMRTTALPGGGALAIGLGLGLGITAWWQSRPRGKRAGKAAGGGVAAMALLLLATVNTGCGGGPREIRYRQDACARCRMILMDQRYGAELVTRHGKALVFDSIECLAAHTREKPGDAVGARGLYVTPYDAPGTLIPAEQAVYLNSGKLPSPMGQNLSASSDRPHAEALLTANGGVLLTWPGVVAQVRQAWRLP